MAEMDDLPKVEGLAEFVAQDFQDKGEEAPPVVQDEPAPVETPVEDKVDRNELGQFKKKEDLLKSYKEIQGFSTKVSQENKALKDQLAQTQAQMQEFMEIQKLSARPQQPPAPMKFDEAFVEDPEKAVEVTVERKLMTARVADVLESEEAKNPTEFQERYAYAMRLRQYYPQLVTSPQGVKKLFELGDKYRTEEMKKYAEKSIKLVFGEDVDVEKFKSMLAKDRPQPDVKNPKSAYMPDTSSGLRPEPGKSVNAHEAQISAAMEKGDVDSVIKGIFAKKFATG